ncbi:hypothetical protein GH721_14735 [Kriegella sp. EG-1]|nr:hypothetical protein [Flavobacteriaceae bacterium EG-1]
MRTILILIFFTFIWRPIVAQNSAENPSQIYKNNELLTFSGLSFPAGVNGELFKNFKINYQFTEQNQFQLQHFYEKFGTFESTNTALLFKHHIAKNIYLFAGPEAVLGINQVNGSFESKQVNIFGGIGFEANTNLLLELGYKARTYNSTNTNFGNPAPTSVMLRASF